MTNYVSEHIKHKLEDYRYYKSEVKLCSMKMEEIDTTRGVHAIRYDKEATQGSSDPITMELTKLELTEQYFYWQKRYDEAKPHLDEINKILSNVDSDLSDAIYNIHCLKISTYEREARKRYMHDKTLQRKVNRELVKYMQNVLQDTIKR